MAKVQITLGAKSDATDYLDRNLTATVVQGHVTPKDVYAVEVDGKPGALCLSCCVDKEVEFVQRGGDDWVVERPCQRCGERQGD